MKKLFERVRGLFAGVAEHNSSVKRVIVIFVIMILINSFLLTSTTFMILTRFHLVDSLHGFRYWPLLFTLQCILIATIMVMGFSESKIGPIHKVIDAMRNVSRGDFSKRVDDRNTSGEIADLVHCYNDMAEELSGIEMFRSDFINNFSHEFKTPIVSIRGFARQLERDDLTEEQRAEYIRIIARESERLSNMSSNILLLTKLENQKIITDRVDYSLDEQLRNCILLLEKQWSDKELELNLDLDEITYHGNEEMMQHVWVNLINNAIKFSPVGGELGVFCIRVQNYIEVRVTDHGEGMTPETRARIFEKFYQGDTAHATEGNGLGLPLANRIVQLCGGRITVNSAPQTGTTFSVFLPVEG